MQLPVARVVEKARLEICCHVHCTRQMLGLKNQTARYAPLPQLTRNLLQVARECGTTSSIDVCHCRPVVQLQTDCLTLLATHFTAKKAAWSSLAFICICLSWGSQRPPVRVSAHCRHSPRPRRLFGGLGRALWLLPAAHSTLPGGQPTIASPVSPPNPG